MQNIFTDMNKLFKNFTKSADKFAKKIKTKQKEVK